MILFFPRIVDKSTKKDCLVMSTAEDLLHTLRQQQDPNHALNDEPDSLINKFQRIRQQSLKLCHELEIEDFELQADAFVSPIKWHLAHTSWFFETFVLKNTPDYQVFHPQFEYLFNSYYNAVGKQYPRDKRGLMSRPTVKEVKAYRQYVDQRLNKLLAATHALTKEQIDLITLGLNHEQQHQELMLTDLKYNLSFNPLYPIYAKTKFPLEQAPDSNPNTDIEALQFIEFGGGIYNFGHKGIGFSFDNETPRHQSLVQDFRIAHRLITNEEYCHFIDAGGYQDPQYWLADGWAWVQQNNVSGPLYWQIESEEGKGEDNKTEHAKTPLRYEFRLTGYGQLHPQQPVTHISFYEADAYARWAGKRLPSEYEWEVASKKRAISGTFVESQSFHPLQLATYKNSSGDNSKDEMKQLFGDCWQWTQSSYAPYPGFKTPEGAVGEYNGKFMCNQMVLRGGSCATPKDHLRATYRNFFYPQDRWQFTGIRLAEDV
jgi:ergothioneine biosynthesis protein EgtB